MTVHLCLIVFKLCNITLPSSTKIHAVSEQMNASRPSSKMLKCHAKFHEKHSLASEYDAITNSETVEHQDPLVSEITTKYDLHLRMKSKNASYKELLPICPTLKLWDIQNKYNLDSYHWVIFICLPKSDPIALHAMIKDSGEINFLGKQINITSQLNPDVRDCMLADFWDKQLLLLIRFEFPLDFDRDSTLLSHNQNHTSAKMYPQDIQAYLDEEVQYKAILGLF